MKTKHKSCYISGKITGESYISCYYKFRTEEEAITFSTGRKVVNPMKICKSHWSWLRCMIVCLWHLITHCDTIVMLDDWEKSKGATIELKVAKLLRYKIIWK